MMTEGREGFRNLLLAALEEVGLANAIRDGRKDKFVSEATILNVLNR